MKSVWLTVLLLILAVGTCSLRDDSMNKLKIKDLFKIPKSYDADLEEDFIKDTGMTWKDYEKMMLQRKKADER
jgi:hypothetical protein